MLVLDDAVVFFELTAGTNQVIDTTFEFFQVLIIHQAAPETRSMVINIGLARMPVNASADRRTVLNWPAFRRPARRSTAGQASRTVRATTVNGSDHYSTGSSGIMAAWI
jgi:hypothetical protein